MLSKRLGLNVRVQRLRRKLTQEQLGELADIHYTFVGHIERGTKLPSLLVLCRIARALGAAPSSLLKGIDSALKGPS